MDLGLAMPRDRAQYWMAVAVLLSAGLVVSQTPAVMVAAMAGLCVAVLFDRVLYR
jgi:hypothetical protein